MKMPDSLEKDPVAYHSPDYPTVCKPIAKSKVFQCVSAGKIDPPGFQ
jgi:hypothetical protein